jgi:hypothetical protein
MQYFDRVGCTSGKSSGAASITAYIPNGHRQYDVAFLFTGYGTTITANASGWIQLASWRTVGGADVWWKRLTSSSELNPTIYTTNGLPYYVIACYSRLSRSVSPKYYAETYYDGPTTCFRPNSLNLCYSSISSESIDGDGAAEAYFTAGPSGAVREYSDSTGGASGAWEAGLWSRNQAAVGAYDGGDPVYVMYGTGSQNEGLSYIFMPPHEAPLDTPGIQSSGNVSLRDIVTEFGELSNLGNLRSYLKYPGGTLVAATDTAPNVPTSGSITMRSSFLGAAKVASIPGATWVASTMPTTANWCSVAYGGGQFVAFIAGSNQCYRSLNGAIWTGPVTLPFNVSTAAACDDVIFIGQDYTNTGAYSRDGGATWTTVTIPNMSGGTWGIGTGAGRFFFWKKGGYTGYNTCLTSTPGTMVSCTTAVPVGCIWGSPNDATSGWRYHLSNNTGYARYGSADGTTWPNSATSYNSNWHLGMASGNTGKTVIINAASAQNFAGYGGTGTMTWTTYGGLTNAYALTWRDGYFLQVGNSTYCYTSLDTSMTSNWAVRSTATPTGILSLASRPGRTVGVKYGNACWLA